MPSLRKGKSSLYCINRNLFATRYFNDSVLCPFMGSDWAGLEEATPLCRRLAAGLRHLPRFPTSFTYLPPSAASHWSLWLLPHHPLTNALLEPLPVICFPSSLLSSPCPPRPPPVRQTLPFFLSVGPSVDVLWRSGTLTMGGFLRGPHCC